AYSGGRKPIPRASGPGTRGFKSRPQRIDGNAQAAAGRPARTTTADRRIDPGPLHRRTRGESPARCRRSTYPATGPQRPHGEGQAEADCESHTSPHSACLGPEEARITRAFSLLRVEHRVITRPLHKVDRMSTI